MNHIYKVIWNKAKNCYTVVSEIAKNHSTSSVTKKKVSIAAILVAGMLSGFSPMVSGAADTTNSEAVVYDQNKTSLKSTNSGSVGKNAIALGKGASAVDNSIAIGNGASVVEGGSHSKDGVALGTNAPAGYKGTSLGNSAISGREGTIVIGDTTNASSLYSTVVGTNSKITSDSTAYTFTSPYFSKSVIVQGAVSTSYGAYNTITNKEKIFSGVANSIIGSVNTVTNSNGVTIQGTGNTVSNAYKDMKFGLGDLLNLKNGDYSSLAQNDSGAIAIIGGGNTISDQLSSTVIGFGNTLKGKNSTGVFTGGSQNTLTNVSNSLVMGDHNTLENRNNVISLGNNNIVTADEAVAIGNGTTVRAESGVAIGVGSVADRVADSEKGARGEFAPDTIPTGQESTWTSTKGAVSVGDTANNITRQITNVAEGREDTDAVNVAQLKKVNEEAGKHSVVTEGANITVTPEQAEDGRMQYNVALNNNIRLSGDNDAFVNISGSNGSVWASSSVAAGNVIMDGTTATVSGLGNTTTAYDGFANGEGKAATEEQLKEVSKVAENANQGWNLSTNGGEASKVAPGETVDISGDKNIKISNDGTNVKVKLNDNIDVNSVQTNALNAKYNLSVGTANENGTVPFFVNSNGAFYAANGKLVVDKDGKVTATEGEIGNVVLKNGVLYKNTALRDGELYVGDADGNYSQITPKSAKLGQVTIDEKGNMAGVNSIQTNALNAKYNLSVGTAADNGTMPFFVNSNGAFYAAGGEFVVDKDGSVKATSGDIGNVKLNDGVFYKNSALRDGELYVGDADGNYSQITSKNAKLGKVMIDDTGRISGVAAGRIAADSTDAVNGSQLHAVQQEAGKHTKVVNGSNITVEETDQDGQKTYKVGLNKDLLLGDITGKNVSISGTNGTIETTGFIATKDKIYADKGAKLADVNVTGDTISNDKSSVKLDKEGTVTINGKVNVDKAGQIHNVTAGTADEDAVNVSQLKKQAAASKTTVSDGTNTNVTSTVAEDGHTDYQVNLNKDLTGIESISNGTKGKSKIVLNEGYAGMAYGDTNVVLMNNGVYLNGKVNVDKAGQIHNVTAGTADEDAVNVSQLNKQAAASKTTVSDGINTTVTSTVAEDGHTDYKVNLNKDLTGIESMTNGLSSIRMGNGGTVTINNRVTIDQSGKISGVAAGEVKEGSTDAVNGSQLKGVENKADKNAENIQKNTEAIAKNTADISKNAEAISKNTENIKNNSKAIAENAKNIQKNTEAIAKNTADISKNTEAIGKLDERVTSVEEVAKKHTTVSTDDTNVQISEDTNKDGGKDYKVSLNKDLNLSSVTTGDTKMDTNGVTVKDVSLTKGGLSIGNKTYVSNEGLNANDQKVTNVAAGDISEKSTDAVNGSQLFATNQQVAQNAQSISKLGNRINKVGAGAAALAALHPLDFDPDDKWDFAAGYGNYNGENAAAIGAYYRPNEDTMFSVGGSFGNGENMVNAGVSLKLGQGNHVSTSKVAMAKEIKDLRKEMEGLKSALLDANAGKKLDTSKLQLFPDVPKNHWAYEYVSTLKGNGVLTGYPDGEFKGDRPMTRYEFATMLYKAMLEGATLSDRILKEFAPELERFTVDTVHQDKDGKPTVERVRTVKAKK